jgi:endonuclease/exonuclease/phosphatase family metal-dependent hydrolase
MKLCFTSCNIRFDNPADNHNSWSHRRHFLTQTLLKHDPDVIATQEGRYDQLKDFESLLEDYELVDHHRSWIKPRMYPSFFIKKNRFELNQSGDSWLSETPDVAGSLSFNSAFPRLMSWCKIQPKNHQKYFLIVNTHLDHIRTETRISQVRVLAQEIKKIWDQEFPLIIMGDFNDSPESEVRKCLNKEFALQDAWQLFNSTEEASHHAFQGEVLHGSRIDWIMVDERLKIESCMMDKSREGNTFPSDHYPVVCHLNF